MIHDALLVLWDCAQASVQNDTECAFSNPGDAEVYARICEVGKGHHRIQNFIAATGYHARKLKSATHSRSNGLYTQALSEGLIEVLETYKKTLVEVEGLVIGNHNYTLSYVYSYVEKYKGLFNTLNRLIVTIKERRLVGCQILSLVHQYILNGNEMVHDSVVKIFCNLNKVFINQLCTWLLYGELKDPYQEFFISNSQKDSDTVLSIPSTTNTADKSLVSTLQDTAIECGYSISANMIPYYMPLSLAQEVLFIGKTVILFGFDPRKVKRNSSFLTSKSLMPLQKIGSDVRRFTIWDEKEAEFHEKLQTLKNPEMLEVCHLRTVVREIKECVTMHLWLVAVEEANLVHELKLMKDFYLLGRGELFLELLRLTAHILDKPTTRTGTRDMNHAFQLAARAVFLSNNSDIEKFSFELPYVKPDISMNSTLEDDSSSVADGWSTIILKYDFKWPLHLLFTPEVLARYNDMFRLLLRIKKTQHDLHTLWKTYKQSTSFAMCQLHNKLMFLMDNLQHYLQADVLETNFSRFMDAVNKTNDFEKLKKAHAEFLADVLSQAFLTVTSDSSSESNDSTDGDSLNNPVFCNMMELIKLCHSFCCMSEVAADRAQEHYYIRGYSDRFNKLVKQLMQLLVSFRDRPCGVYLARLLMRLDYNRWLSGEAQLTQSVTNMLRY
ncbi:spc97 / spc98 family domain-containing protein [Phthorimaea operculella]|nr:spc97 / spc98 family domain-containing protein [Phthorimaea operculella]